MGLLAIGKKLQAGRGGSGGVDTKAQSLGVISLPLGHRVELLPQAQRAVELAVCVGCGHVKPQELKWFVAELRKCPGCGEVEEVSGIFMADAAERFTTS